MEPFYSSSLFLSVCMSFCLQCTFAFCLPSSLSVYLSVCLLSHCIGPSAVSPLLCPSLLMTVFQFFGLSAHLIVFQSSCLSVHLSVCLTVCLSDSFWSIRPLFCPSVPMSVSDGVCLVHLFVCQSNCLFIRLSISPWPCLFVRPHCFFSISPSVHIYIYVCPFVPLLVCPSVLLFFLCLSFFFVVKVKVN